MYVTVVKMASKERNRGLKFVFASTKEMKIRVDEVPFKAPSCCKQYGISDIHCGICKHPKVKTPERAHQVSFLNNVTTIWKR
jgi:hypothetical protein